MAYEDFSINEKSMEEMAKQFASAKVMSEQEEEMEKDDTQNLIYDIYSGLKIFERLLFTAKGQTKNQKLLSFIHTSETATQEALQEMLKMKNDIMPRDIDFELPKTDGEIIGLIRNVLSSLLVSLAEILKENTSNETISKLIEIIGTVLKDSLNI